MAQNKKGDNMRKKIALLLSVCCMMLMLVACGTDPKSEDYNGKSYDDLYQASEGWVAVLAGHTVDDVQSAIDGVAGQKLTEEQRIQVELFESGISAVRDLGEFVSIGEFTVEKSGNTLTTTERLVFEEREVDFQIVYSYYNMEVIGYTVEPVYSLGEKMQKAGINTLISMTTVFGVLILISLIISCFNIFPYLEAKKKAQKQANAPAKESVVSQIEAKEELLTDDTELVAVIAAAIAASTGQSTTDFVVRSINRR